MPPAEPPLTFTEPSCSDCPECPPITVCEVVAVPAAREVDVVGYRGFLVSLAARDSWELELYATLLLCKFCVTAFYLGRFFRERRDDGSSRRWRSRVAYVEAGIEVDSAIRQRQVVARARGAISGG